MVCTIEGMKWILRTRASITACALERSQGYPKLWWTLEGIPASDDPQTRPTEQQAARFVEVANLMAREAMPGLHLAYRDALREIQIAAQADIDLLPQRIRISLSDNDGRPFAKVLDEIPRTTFSRLAVSEEPELAEVRAGIAEFATFVDKVKHTLKLNGPGLDDRTVSVNSDLQSIKGLIYKHDYTDEQQILLAGLARAASTRGGYHALSPEQKRIELGEGYLRTFSAARPLSAMLASREALLLDSKLSPQQGDGR
jgi:hypothetical protein